MPDGGVDYTWHTDVDNISRDDIQKLGVGSIGRLDISAPCKDFAMSRLLPCRWGGKLNDPRPGLRGKYGKVLLTCLEVAAWVLELNTDCEFFCENLPFTDIVADWKVMCLALGQPVVLDSADISQLYSQEQGILDQHATAIISGGANSRLLSSRAQPIHG